MKCSASLTTVVSSAFLGGMHLILSYNYQKYIYLNYLKICDFERVWNYAFHLLFQTGIVSHKL